MVPAKFIVAKDRVYFWGIWKSGELRVESLETVAQAQVERLKDFGSLIFETDSKHYTQYFKLKERYGSIWLS